VITLVLGGTRSGKSAVAERLVLAHAGPLAYLATGWATDSDMADRIERHRRARDARFTTFEVGAGLASGLREAPAVPALVDALGTWVAGLPEFADGGDSVPLVDRDARFEQLADELIDALVVRGAPTVVVSDEVGLGVHPSSAIGRRFRDLVGTLNQRVAAVADEALLVVAGRTLRLDPPPEPA
jgi:adenosyl cobinamide kinase/adenosyl cobinamide phosphate guanylyltransferase